MKLDQQVCSFAQAQKLVELNLRVKSQLYWQPASDSPDSSDKTICFQPDMVVADEQFPALSVAELGLLLPSVVHLEEEDYYLQGSIGNREGEFYYIWFQSSVDNVEWEIFPAIEKDTEAEARAEALIWLIENEFVDATSLKL